MIPAAFGLCDHLDVRVRDVTRARRFYHPFCAALGLTRVELGAEWITYAAPDPSLPFLAITGDAQFVANNTRLALRGDSRDAVDRISAVAKSAGARSYEPPRSCPEYGEGYYASFFEDPDGTKYEICYRPLAPVIARLWRGKVRSGMLDSYREYVASTGLADYGRTPGNRGARMLTAPGPEFGHALTLSFWDSYDSISGFAGRDIRRARYYPEDERYLLDFPEHVEHFDVTSS